MISPPTRVFDILNVVSRRPGESVVFSSVKNGEWLDYTVADYLHYADLTSYALIKFCISKGEPVLSITHNRAEFNFVDMGILQTGAVHVPVYPGVDIDKLAAILSETGARIAFISNRSVLRKIQQIQPCPLRWIISFDKTEGTIAFDDFLSEGTLNPGLLLSLKAGVQPDDAASIIYLSGSNTPLKGVVLSHAGHVFNLLSYCKFHHFKNCSNSISFLPLAHSFERTVNYSFQYLGIKVYYNEGIATLTKILRQQKPDVMLAVPLVLERIVGNFKNEIDQIKGAKGWLARLALIWAAKHKAATSRGRFPLKKALFALVFKGLSDFFGGNIKVLLCGGAALRPEVLNILWAAGINTYEGYGLTEAGPLVSYNHAESFKAYTVGKPMPGVKVRIASDQEVLVKSGGLMTGYYKQTTSPIDGEGWLHTGDLGSVDKTGFLTLTGIKKEIFKLSSGLYTDPRPIEGMFVGSKFIKQIWVYGHNRAFLTAILVLKNSKSSSSEIRTSPDTILANDADHDSKKAGDEISDYNSTCPKYDQIVKFEVTIDEWTKENGLLCPDGSLNRPALYMKYRKSIEALYL